jgi:hypothetical protein
MRVGPYSTSADPWYSRILTACAFLGVGLGVLHFAVATIYALLNWSSVIDRLGFLGPFAMIGYSFLILP